MDERYPWLGGRYSRVHSQPEMDPDGLYERGRATYRYNPLTGRTEFVPLVIAHEFRTILDRNRS